MQWLNCNTYRRIQLSFTLSRSLLRIMPRSGYITCPLIPLLLGMNSLQCFLRNTIPHIRQQRLEMPSIIFVRYRENLSVIAGMVLRSLSAMSPPYDR